MRDNPNWMKAQTDVPNLYRRVLYRLSYSPPRLMCERLMGASLIRLHCAHFSHIFPSSSLPLWTCRTPKFADPLMLSLHLFFYACLVIFPLSLCFARWFWSDKIWWMGNMPIALQFASLHDCQEISKQSHCLLDLNTDIVFFCSWDMLFLIISLHFHRLYSS